MKNVIHAGLFTLLGAIISGLIMWSRDSDIKKKEFEYGLIADAMSIEDTKVRTDKIKFYISTGLIQSIETDSIIEKVNYHSGFKRGQDDARAERHLVGGIREYIKIFGKSPRNLEELQAQIPIDLPLNHFDKNMMYRAWAEDKLLLRLPGRDGILFTDDDSLFTYDSIN